MLVPFNGSTGPSAASVPGATTIDIEIQQPLCATVSLVSFGYIITSSTVSLPNADLGSVSILLRFAIYVQIAPCSVACWHHRLHCTTSH